MAKAAGRSVSVPVGAKTAPQDDDELVELAARLADLGRAQQEARGAIGEDDPNYAAVFERRLVPPVVATLRP